MTGWYRDYLAVTKLLVEEYGIGDRFAQRIAMTASTLRGYEPDLSLNKAVGMALQSAAEQPPGFTEERRGARIPARIPTVPHRSLFPADMAARLRGEVRDQPAKRPPTMAEIGMEFRRNPRPTYPDYYPPHCRDPE
ncbi:hypothetical protein [Paludisphaera rhizosphaerae]|uniref:hypothetical protein n=1 Tax=Paludisphaera rhizosphaerae TaxID=2711216 RepID=UPI0013E9E603|nr:hypothetical protein [Paludisphaera rhizosphaerae]